MVVHYVEHWSYPPEVVLAFDVEWQDMMFDLKRWAARDMKDIARLELSRDEYDGLCREFKWLNRFTGTFTHDAPSTILGIPVTIVQEHGADAS